MTRKERVDAICAEVWEDLALFCRDEDVDMIQFLEVVDRRLKEASKELERRVNNER